MTRQRALRILIGIGVVVSAAASASPTCAQSAFSLDGIAAEALFDEGVRLMGNDDASSACPKLQRSYELDPGIGTLLYLGDCYRSIGKTASAWMAFRSASFAAGEAGQRDREQAASSYAETLRPQLVLLRLQLRPEQPDVTILLDGHTLPPELIDVPFAVDPGKHVLRLSAPGFEPQEKVVVFENKPGVVEVSIPLLKPPPAVVEPKPVPVRPSSVRQDIDVRGSVGWLLLGAGAGALAIGGGLSALTDNMRTGLGIAAGGAVGAGIGGLLLFRSGSSQVRVGVSTGASGGALLAEQAF